jgi:hypothetical protein
MALSLQRRRGKGPKAPFPSCVAGPPHGPLPKGAKDSANKPTGPKHSPSCQDLEPSLLITLTSTYPEPMFSEGVAVQRNRC